MDHNFDAHYELSRSKQRKTPCTILADLIPSLPIFHLAILLYVCHTTLMTLVQRIWYSINCWSLYWYFIDIFLYCHHLSVWYCIEWYIITIVWRNSFLVTHRSWRVQITQILSFWRGLSMHGKVKNKGTYSKKIISIKSQKKLANFSKIWMDCCKCTGVSLVTILKFKWSRAKCEKMK